MLGPLNRLLAVRILLDVQFWFPTWLIFLLEQGFSPLQAAIADALFHAVIVLAEVPMGRLVDRVGRKPALLLTCALTTVVFCGISIVDSVGLLMVVWALWGVLWALASGLDTTYAWELAETRPNGVSPHRYLGRTRIVGGLAGGLSLLTAGTLMVVWEPLPFVTTAVLGAIALVLAATVPAIPRSHITAHAQVHGSMREALQHPLIGTGVALGAIVLTAGITIRILFQPIGLELGFGPIEISIGYTMIAVAVAVGSWVGAQVPARHRGRAVVTAVAVMGSSYALVAVSMTLSLGWLTLLGTIPLGTAAFGVGKTVTDVWLVESVGPRRRATVLSLCSAASGLVMTVLRPLLVLLSGATSSEISILAWGGLTGLLGLVCIALAQRLRRSHYGIGADTV